MRPVENEDSSKSKGAHRAVEVTELSLTFSNKRLTSGP